jgi:hypothetical protein
MLRTFHLLLSGLFAISQAPATEAQRVGAALDGVYLAWRTNTPISTPEQEYMTFYPDGRVYHDDPDEGLAQPLDWSRVCQSTQCGTYQVAGNTVAVRWASGSEQRFQLEPGGVLKLDGSTRRFRPLASLDGLRLEGVYARLNGSGDVAVGITLSREGEFREYNLLPYTNWVMRGDGAQRRRLVVGEGWGRYSIRRNTLELQYSNGLTARLMIFVPPGEAPGGNTSTIYINRTALTRKE